LESVNYDRTHVKEVYENTYANKVKSFTEIKDEHVSTDIRFNNVLKKLDIKNLNRHSLLDIACGDGVKTNALSQYFKNALGVDFSANAIQACNSTFKSDVLAFIELDIDNQELDQKFDFITSFGNSTFNISNIEVLTKEIIKVYHKFSKASTNMLVGTFTDFSGTAPSGWYNLTTTELTLLQKNISDQAGLNCTLYFPHADINNYLSNHVKYTAKEVLRIITQKRKYFYLVLTPKK
jgi:SAM-dependent methyltransferase